MTVHSGAQTAAMPKNSLTWRSKKSPILKILLNLAETSPNLIRQIDKQNDPNLVALLNLRQKTKCAKNPNG